MWRSDHAGGGLGAPTRHAIPWGEAAFYDVERTDDSGRASSVHFLHFPFTPDRIKAFRAPGAEIIAGIGHPAYGHMVILPEAVRQALSEDFD